MEFVTSRDELRTIYKQPGDGAVRKEQRRLDDHCKNFIAKSPFVLIGSSDTDGNADVTPKGDKPGFAAELMLKDLLLSQAAAEATDAATPLGAAATAFYQAFVDHGGRGKDFSAVLPRLTEMKRGDEP